MGAHDILPGRRGGGAQPIGGWDGGDKYNLNNPKQSSTILSKVEGLTPTIIALPKHNICM